MKTSFHRQLPNSNSATRRAIFQGQKFIAPPTEATLDLIASVKQALVEKLETDDIRHAHLYHSEIEFFERMGELRKLFYLGGKYHDRLRSTISSLGFEPGRCAFDPLRIRVILPGGHQNPKAAPVYFAHRDTWYAHPQSLIVGWIPLHDLKEKETFEFYPDYFDREVPNNSEIFDYGDWVKDGPALKIGWQKEDSGLTGGYPRALIAESPKRAEGFEINAGETLLFAGSQFHKTHEQDFGTIRFSLDFRLVQLDDAIDQIGAPNADNRSKGEILKDYIHPVS